MRCVFIGEYSGMFYGLASGLRSLGHEAHIIADGDGFKQIPADWKLKSQGRVSFAALQAYRTRLLSILDQIGAVDVINVVNAGLFGASTFILLGPLRQRARSLVVFAAGDDHVVASHSRSLGRSLFRDCETGARRIKWPYIIKHWVFESPLLRCANAIIPIMYDYAEPYRRSRWARKLSRVLPLAFDAGSIKPRAAIDSLSGSVCIYHGVTRPEEKGTRYIEAAFRRLASAPGPWRLDLGRAMPLGDYLGRLDGVDILVDQCRSHSYAMNAIIGMAKGCVVCSPCSDECLAEYGLQRAEIPVQDVDADPGAIAGILEKLSCDRALLGALQRKGLEFVRSFHHPKRIASLYLEAVRQTTPTWR